MVFRDRHDAGQALTERLSRYRGMNPLVLAIPRGGVLVGSVVARELGGDLDVALVAKLRAPGNPELAIGAVTETGEAFWEGHPLVLQMANGGYRQQELREAVEKLRRRRQAYTPSGAPADPSGRQVIVVDDGIATGSTMIAALRGLDIRGAARRIAAAPVAPARTPDLLARYADEVAVLHLPEEFTSVSQFYEDFRDVNEEEVVSALEQSRVRARRAA
jgi:predicted phosphoribosyltransferase